MLCSPSLLRPQSERPITDIRMTERSSQIVDNDIIASQNRYLYCFYCGKQLNTKAGKTLHEKMHERNLVKRKRLSRKPKRRVYTCKQCNEQFIQKRHLNNHMKTHMKLIECTFCHKTFKDRMAFEMHDATDGMHYDSFDAPPAYRTRSHSRMSCHNISIQNRPSSCDPGFHSLRASSPVSECESELLSTRRARSRAGSTVSSIGRPRNEKSRRKTKSVDAWLRTKRYDTDGDDSDGGTSCRSPSPSPSVWNSARSDATSVASTQYLCSHPACLKTFPTLNWVTTHEMSEHKMLALFRCKECRKRFTTSKNLQHHRIDEHANVVICVFCDQPLHGIAAIEEHFQLHRKYSVKCEICGKLYLSKHNLDEHLKQKNRFHKNNAPYNIKPKILMRYDRRETRKFTIVHDAFYNKSDIGVIDYSYSKLQGEQKDQSSIDFEVDLPWRT